MRKINRQIICMLALGLVLIPSVQPRAFAQDAVVSYQSFYDNLAPYGQWVYDPAYGNVWVPNVEPGFRPYATEGHWAMTEYGNMWVSESPWGWACYHYGRWTYNSYYGWIWIPGHEWAPAWVSWRSGGGYYGWAPMGPGYRPGGVYEYPDNYWVFVGPEYLYHPHVYSYYEPSRTNIYISHSSYITETYEDHGSHTSYYYGPRREVIERESHRPVEVYRVSSASAPGESHVSGGSVSVYRPAINRETATSARPANVVTATHPVGRPERFSDERTQPAFHQEMHNQNPAGNNHNTGRPEPPTYQQEPGRGVPEQHTQPMQQEHVQQPAQREQERPAQGRPQEVAPREQERPAQGRPQQYQQPQPQGRSQQYQQPQEREPQRSQPRPQAQPQPRPQQRPQPAPRPQHQGPVREEKRK